MPDHTDESASRAQAGFAALLDAAVDAIMVIDKHGRIEAFNRAAEKMFGYTAHEVQGKNIKVLMPEPYRGEHDGYMHHYLTTGEKKIIGIGREVSAQRSNGEVFPINLSVGEIENGSEPRFVGIVNDISERKKNERLMRQQQERLEHVMRLETLGEMAAGIAHEINQPLSAIATYAHAAQRLIASGQMDEARILSVLKKTGDQAERAGEIIRRIRNLARRRPANRERHDLHAVVEEALRLAEIDARLRDVDLRLEGSHGLPEAWLDPVQIQQVILNLIRNAMETTPPSKKIVVRTLRLSYEEVATEVSDDGPGLAPDAGAEIFNPFFTTKEHGTGMGLSISRSIVATHGGRLEVRNNEDGGATFSLILPTVVGSNND